MYVFNRPKYVECIFVTTQTKLTMFCRNDIGRYQVFHTESLYNVSTHAIKNRNNQILVCYKLATSIKIRVVFDSVRRYSSNSFPKNYSVYSNDSGEEIWVTVPKWATPLGYLFGCLSKLMTRLFFGRFCYVGDVNLVYQTNSRANEFFHNKL